MDELALLGTLTMVMRGYHDEHIRKLIGGNFLRVIRPMLSKQPNSPVLED